MRSMSGISAEKKVGGSSKQNWQVKLQRQKQQPTGNAQCRMNPPNRVYVRGSHE